MGWGLDSLLFGNSFVIDLLSCFRKVIEFFYDSFNLFVEQKYYLFQLYYFVDLRINQYNKNFDI